MKAHHFVTTSSTLENLVYRMLFSDGEEREIPLPQTTLFSISQGPWSRSKAEMDDPPTFSQLPWALSGGSTIIRHPPARITHGRPRARSRTRELPRHTTEMHPLGHHGIDPHLGQKPKLGGRYTDITLILYIMFGRFFVYPFVSFSFWFLLLLSKNPKI